MNRFQSFYLILALLCLNVTYSFAGPNVNANEKAVAHLNNFRSDYVKSLLEKKAELIADYYAENIRLMPEFQKTVIGKRNSLSYHKAFSARFDLKEYSREAIEIIDLGSQVLEIGNMRMKLSLKSTGQKYDLKGAYLNIWEESENGDLMLVTEAWNYNHYYEGIHELLRFNEVPAVHAALLANVPVDSDISFELAALNKLLDATVTQHNDNIWSLFYADDAMLIANYHPILKGRKEIDEYIRMHVKELPTFEGLDIRNDRIDDLGEYVIEYASHIASWKNGESSGVGLGKNIRIWRRGPNHSLKIFRAIAMYD